jgi:hypothetical protein
LLVVVDPNFFGNAKRLVGHCGGVQILDADDWYRDEKRVEQPISREGRTP